MWKGTARGKPPGIRPVDLDKAIHLVAARYQLWNESYEWDAHSRRYHVDEYELLAERFGYRNGTQARKAFNKYKRMIIGC